MNVWDNVKNWFKPFKVLFLYTCNPVSILCSSDHIVHLAALLVQAADLSSQLVACAREEIGFLLWSHYMLQSYMTIYLT